MRPLLVRAAAAAGFALAPLAAHAAVVTVSLPRTLSSVPVSVSLGSAGTASFGFTLDTTGFVPATDISTVGTGAVSTSSGFFGGGIADFGAGAPIDGTGLFTFAAYSTPTIIPNSQADDFVGLSYAATDGTHYGYAEVFGGTLVGYGYETAPNTTILTAAISPVTTAVPEPSSLVLIAIGCLAVGSTGLRRRSARAWPSPS